MLGEEGRNSVLGCSWAANTAIYFCYEQSTHSETMLKKLPFYRVSMVIVFAMNLTYLLSGFENWIGGVIEADFVNVFPSSRIVDAENLSPLVGLLYPTLSYGASRNNGIINATGGWWALTFGFVILWSALIAIIPTKVITDVIFTDRWAFRK